MEKNRQTRNVARADFLNAVSGEVDRAYQKHGDDQWGRHEFYGVLREELDEVWDAIKDDLPMDHLMTEIVQLAGVCLRYVETGDRYNFVGK